MACVLALDIGAKRTGLAISDENQIFAFPHDTVETRGLTLRIQKISQSYPLAGLVVGIPMNLKNEPTDNTSRVQSLIVVLHKAFPSIPIFGVDERFTSRMAQQAMVAGGMKKKERRVKENTDKLSATLILQSYLEQKKHLKPLFS